MTGKFAPKPPMIVLGNMQAYVTDEKIADLTEDALYVTPHDLNSDHHRPVFRVDTGDNLGCFVVVDRPSALFDTLMEACEDTQSDW